MLEHTIKGVKKMKDVRTLTKRKMKITSIYLTQGDHASWLAAASVLGISRSELLRLALREKTNKVLSEQVAREQ